MDNTNDTTLAELITRKHCARHYLLTCLMKD